jgi:hypothetical protein
MYKLKMQIIYLLKIKDRSLIYHILGIILLMIRKTNRFILIKLNILLKLLGNLGYRIQTQS